MTGLLRKWRSNQDREYERDIKYKLVGTLAPAPRGVKRLLVGSELWYLGGQFAWDMLDWQVLRNYNSKQMGIQWGQAVADFAQPGDPETWAPEAGEGGDYEHTQCQSTVAKATQELLGAGEGEGEGGL